MIGLWMVYAVVVAALLAGAAAALERVLRLRGRPARGVWMAALAGSWILPVLTWLRPPEAVAPSPAVPGASGEAGVDPALLARLLEGAAAAPAAAPGWIEPLGNALVATWAVLAVGGVVLFALAVRAVARRARGWPTRSVLGQPVRVSTDFGPAVVGLRRPEIVLPEWVMELGRTAQELVLRHESEHRDARDTLLLAAGTLTVLAAPWNPALWWQLRRLRLAVELDCDARVLRSGVSARSYGRLLLSVGERMGGSVVPVAALAEPPSFLERRLKMITERKPNGSVWAVAAGVAAAGLLVAAACEAPAPPAAEEARDVVEVPVTEERRWSAELAEVPVEEASQLAEPAEVPVRAYTEVEPLEVDEAAVSELRAVEEAAVERLRAAEPAAAPEPLLVVDGVIQARKTTDLDALDVERVEVLKGDAAASLYGTRARGGVIQVTTKREGDRPVQERPVRGGEATAVFRVREVAPEPPSLTERALNVAGRGILSALDLIAKPILNRLDASARPLVVVDGEVWSEAKLRTLDSDRIDRVEVLKGDAAKKEWGTRGANGVVKIHLRNF